MRIKGEISTKTAGLTASRGEWLSFIVGSTLVGLNVIVKSCVAVRPDASRADHVWAIVVPLAGIALAVGMYPRLRPGARATVALFCGALALIWGALAVEAVVAEGLSAGSVTGFILIPAGAGLLGLGAHTLWRSRKGGRFRYLRRGLYVIIGVLAVYWIMLPIGMAVVATERPRTDLPMPAPGFPVYEEVVLQTADGVSLGAWYIPSQNGAAVIAFPREWTMQQAAMLARHGYGVLMLDMRGYGTSGGDPNGWGWGSTRDIVPGLAFLASRPDVLDARVEGWGCQSEANK